MTRRAHAPQRSPRRRRVRGPSARTDVRTTEIDKFFCKARRFRAQEWGYFYHRLLSIPATARDLAELLEFSSSHPERNSGQLPRTKLAAVSSAPPRKEG